MRAKAAVMDPADGAWKSLEKAPATGRSLQPNKRQPNNSKRERKRGRGKERVGEGEKKRESKRKKEKGVYRMTKVTVSLAINSQPMMECFSRQLLIIQKIKKKERRQKG